MTASRQVKELAAVSQAILLHICVLDASLVSLAACEIP
jgi:hypothetical protein